MDGFLLPISHILTKSFLRIEEAPEYAMAMSFLMDTGLSIRQSRYYLTRTGQRTWLDRGFGNLPMGLSRPLRYWETPWLAKIRPPVTWKGRLWRELWFPRLIRRFRRNFDAMAKHGWVGPPVSGLLLADPKLDVLIATDGNHRLGIQRALCGEGILVPIKPKIVRYADRFDIDYKLWTDGDASVFWEHCVARGLCQK